MSTAHKVKEGFKLCLTLAFLGAIIASLIAWGLAATILWVFILGAFVGGVVYEWQKVDNVGRLNKALKDHQKAGATTLSAAEEIAKLASLRDSGALSDAEFSAQKARLLA